MSGDGRWLLLGGASVLVGNGGPRNLVGHVEEAREREEGDGVEGGYRLAVVSGGLDVERPGEARVRQSERQQRIQRG